MTQDFGDRLDRIEAALDNQVAVNAELRTSTQQLSATAEALLSTVQIHQQNFEVLTATFNALVERQLQSETRLDEYQRTTSAALDRIGAVLDYLVRQQDR
jgi:ABC-type transporter Mla subunit MlaD